MIICLKGISEENFSFSGNAKIINATTLNFKFQKPKSKIQFLQKSNLYGQSQTFFKSAL